MRSAHLPTLALVLCLAAATACKTPREQAITVYGGQYVDNSLPEEIALAQPLHPKDAFLVAAAYSRVFAEPSRHLRWELEGNVAQWFGQQDHQELNGLVTLRWMTFPWDKYLNTTFGFGNGLSFATSEPKLEEQFHPETGTSQLLYYIAVEFSFAAPSAKHWSVITRVHHRSGVFGLFDGVDGGSNVITAGLRYAF